MDEIFTGMSRGVPGVQPDDMHGPAATFEDPALIARAASLRHGPDKLFLGVIGGKMAGQGGDRYVTGGQLVGVADDRHAITIAGSRAGKGRSAIVPNMLSYRGSVLAVDPKGELALLTARARARAGQRVCVLDPFGTTKGQLAEFETGFNPVALMRPESLIEDAVLIADALVVPEGGDPHWSESARTFIEGVILEVATAERFKDSRNLVIVRELIGQGESEINPATGDIATDIEILGTHMKKSKNSAVRMAEADFFDRPDRERDSVLSTARRHLRALAFPEIASSLERGGLDLADLKRSALTVYLCLPGRHIGTCGRWLRLFVNLALQAMDKTHGAPRTGSPVLFVLDEFASLGHMRQIEDAAGQIAGFGVKLWPILQDLGQLKALYKDRWETFMGNAGILQFFGNNDLTTLEWLSKRLGNTVIRQESTSPTTPDARMAGAGGPSLSPHTTAIMEPHEAALFFGRNDPFLRQLVIRAGFRPMILQRAFYDKHEAFRGR